MEATPTVNYDNSNIVASYLSTLKTSIYGVDSFSQRAVDSNMTAGNKVRFLFNFLDLILQKNPLTLTEIFILLILLLTKNLMTQTKFLSVSPSMRPANQCQYHDLKFYKILQKCERFTHVIRCE